jgi:hypothetical protein
MRTATAAAATAIVQVPMLLIFQLIFSIITELGIIF